MSLDHPQGVSWSRHLTRSLAGSLLAFGVGAAVAFPGTKPWIFSTLMGMMIVNGALYVVTKHLTAQLARCLMVWINLAFFVHVAFGWLVLSQPSLINQLGPDAGYYHEIASKLAEAWHDQGPIPHLPPGQRGFVVQLGIVYWLIGPAPIAGVVSNAVLFSLTVLVLTLLTLNLFGEGPALRVPPLMNLIPTFVIWSGQLLKEAGAWFFLALTVAAALTFMRKKSVSSLLVACIAAFVLMDYRNYVAQVLVGSLIIGAAIGGLRTGPANAPSRFGRGLFMVGIAGALVLIANGFLLGASGRLTEIDQYRQATDATAGSGFSYVADSTGLGTSKQVLAHLPLSFARFVVGPFLWEASKDNIGGALVESFILLGIVWPRLWRGWRVLWRGNRPMFWIILLPATGLGLAMSAAVGNYGLLFRERMQVLVLLVPVIALGSRGRVPTTSGRL